MNTSVPIQPPLDPLAYPGTVAILLSEAASRRLLLEGDTFTLAARASYPQYPGRLAIFFATVDPETKRDLALILAGSHTARPRPKARPMLPAPPPPDPAADDHDVVRLPDLDELVEPTDADLQ